MILPISFRADWTRISEKKKRRIDENNARENAKRIRHEYSPGDKILLESPTKVGKLEDQYKGPYEILQVNTNGTVRIQRGAVRETVNIRRITPYHERVN